ncbi:hypothetical protein BX264_5179 [Streptomyces sp. 2333.5]|nr:hypothetical protein BX264_5179 [Streptomyces sp. 2333.5]SEE86905.1 hypothetical protein SAMN05428942_5280 [Streptomyces sp. 2112.2]
MHWATRTFSHPKWVTPLSTAGPPSTAPDQDPHAPTSCATVEPCDDTPDGTPHRPPTRPEAFPPAASSPWAPALGDRSPPGGGRRFSAARDHSRSPLSAPASGSPRRPYGLRPRPGSRAHPARAASSRPAPWRCCWPRPRPRCSLFWGRASRTLPPSRPWARRWSTGHKQRRSGPVSGRRRVLRARKGPGAQEGPAAWGTLGRENVTSGWDIPGSRRGLRLRDTLGIPRAPSPTPIRLLGNGPGLWQDRRGYGPPCCAAGILLPHPGRPATAASTWPHPPARRYGPRPRVG